jgi:hypothetical protein
VAQAAGALGLTYVPSALEKLGHPDVGRGPMWNPGIVGRLDHVGVRVVASGGRRDTVLWYGATWEPAGVDLRIRRRRWTSLVRGPSGDDIEMGSSKRRLVASSHAAPQRLRALLTAPVRDALAELADQIGDVEIRDGTIDGSGRYGSGRYGSGRYGSGPYNRLRPPAAGDIVAAVRACVRVANILRPGGSWEPE